MSALSSLECFYYAMYFIGAAAYSKTGNKKRTFQLTGKPGSIDMNSAIDAFSSAFNGDPLSVALAAVKADPQYLDLKHWRNLLTHRLLPGRWKVVRVGVGPSQEVTREVLTIIDKHSEGLVAASRHETKVTTNLTEDPLVWLTTTLTSLISEAEMFIRTRL
jgi:hypothetical protein